MFPQCLWLVIDCCLRWKVGKIYHLSLNQIVSFTENLCWKVKTFWYMLNFDCLFQHFFGFFEWHALILEAAVDQQLLFPCGTETQDFPMDLRSKEWEVYKLQFSIAKSCQRDESWGSSLSWSLRFLPQMPNLGLMWVEKLKRQLSQVNIIFNQVLTYTSGGKNFWQNSKYLTVIHGVSASLALSAWKDEVNVGVMVVHPGSFLGEAFAFILSTSPPDILSSHRGKCFQKGWWESLTARLLSPAWLNRAVGALPSLIPSVAVEEQEGEGQGGGRLVSGGDRGQPMGPKPLHLPHTQIFLFSISETASFLWSLGGKC